MNHYVVVQLKTDADCGGPLDADRSVESTFLPFISVEMRELSDQRDGSKEYYVFSDEKGVATAIEADRVRWITILPEDEVVKTVC